MPARAEEFQAVSPTLYSWSVYEPEVKCELFCTALLVHGGWAVIDPVPLAEPAWKELLALAPLRAVLLTNGNHPRDAAELRRLHSVPIVTAPDARREMAGLRPDITLLPTELLYGIRAIPIPGATIGETAYLSETGVMTVGDAVLNLDSARGLELLPAKYAADPEQNRQSLRNLLDFDFDTLTFAHGSPVTERAREKLKALLDSSP